MPEVYQDQFRPYVPHTIVGALYESQWTYPSMLCYAVFNLRNAGDEAGARGVNDLMVSGLLANGWIDMLMKMQREGKI